jgi:hypothetical protein
MLRPCLLAQPLTRRHLLERCANGFGALALSALMNDPAYGGPATTPAAHPLAPRSGHHKARATSVIFLYMNGGPSQVDTFDPKPLLDREHGKPIKMKIPPSQFIPFGSVPKVLRSPWKFRRYGKGGIAISDLFPHLARCADDLCILRSMTSSTRG